MRLFRPEALKPPRDFVAPVLPVDRPVWLEIGAGVGMHALNCARQNPEIHVYAIERTAEKFNKFLNSYQADPIANLQPIHADALPWVVHGLPPQSIAKLFILYPNPEPKNPAQRWLNMPFFGFLLSRLQDGAEIVLASNIPAYLGEAEQQARAVWQLPVTRHVVSGDVAGAGRTHFEVKYLARGESCGELRMLKPVGYVTVFDGVYN